MIRRQNIIELKRKLYKALLTLPYEYYTEADRKVGFELAVDPDIQNIFNRKLAKEREELNKKLNDEAIPVLDESGFSSGLGIRKEDDPDWKI